MKVNNKIFFPIFCVMFFLFCSKTSIHANEEINDIQDDSIIIEQEAKDDELNQDDSFDDLDDDNSYCDESSDILDDNSDDSILEENEKEVISKEDISEEESEKADLTYQSHVQNVGWQDEKNNNEISGTTDGNKRLEAIKIELSHPEYAGSIQYQTHIQQIGWEKDWKKDGEVSGTTGKSLRLEAIRIVLSGEISNYYDIYYRTYIQNVGWLSWAKNGEDAGTQGFGYRLEAIQILLNEKSANKPSEEGLSFVNKNQNRVSYSTHVQTYGWQKEVSDGTMAGTSGQSKRLEAIKIELNDLQELGSIEYITHVQNLGWSNSWAKDEQQSGTTGQSLRLEAIRIRLTGTLAQFYDVYYRVHVQNYGWMDWTLNGLMSGTSGHSKRLEGIEIKLVARNEQVPTSSSTISTIEGKKGYCKNNVVTNFKNTSNATIYFDQYGTMKTGNFSVGNKSFTSNADGNIVRCSLSGVKYYSQLDYRWAYNVYGYYNMASTGCAPTSLAMAFSTIKQSQILPNDVAWYLYNYTDTYNKKVPGTMGTGVPLAAKHFNVQYAGLSSPEEIKKALLLGKVVVAAQGGNSPFINAPSTHEVMLHGYNGGATTVYDPYNSYLNGSYSINSLWNWKSRDPDDAKGGYVFYAIG